MNRFDLFIELFDKLILIISKYTAQIHLVSTTILIKPKYFQDS